MSFFQRGLQDSFMHLLSSGSVGLAAFCLTWITYSSCWQRECPLLSRTLSDTPDARHIFRQSLSVGLFASLATHVCIDYWPVVRTILARWW
jgi:hypothetical protein